MSTIAIAVQTPDGTLLHFTIQDDITISDLKHLIQIEIDMPTYRQKLHKGEQVLLGYNKLSSYNIPAGAVIVLSLQSS